LLLAWSAGSCLSCCSRRAILEGVPPPPPSCLSSFFRSLSSFLRRRRSCSSRSTSWLSRTFRTIIAYYNFVHALVFFSFMRLDTKAYQCPAPGTTSWLSRTLTTNQKGFITVKKIFFDAGGWGRDQILSSLSRSFF
jgi:hypothetical protein